MNAPTQTYETPDEIAEVLPVVDAVMASLDRRLPIHISRDDLASAGKLALIEALRRFEGPTREARAYCFTRVRGAVYDELRRLDPLSRRTRAQVSLVQQARTSLEANLGRLPTDGEISQATGMALDKLRQLDRLTTATALRSLQEENAEGEPLHQVADVDTPCPAQVVEDEDLAETVQDALERLPRTQAYVVRRYHFEDATLDQIAGEIGISRERVRQLKVAAEKKLRGDLLLMGLWHARSAAA